MVQKVQCKRCDAWILPQTAEMTGQRCMPCYKSRLSRVAFEVARFLAGLLLGCLWGLVQSAFDLFRYGLNPRCWTTWFVRRKVARQLDRCLPPDWSLVKYVWEHANGVYLGPIGPGAKRTLECRCFDHCVQCSNLDEAVVLSETDSKHVYVVAYCLAVLLWRHSPLQFQIPEAACQRSEPVRVQLGCIGSSTTLGSFVEHMISRYGL